MYPSAHFAHRSSFPIRAYLHNIHYATKHHLKLKHRCAGPNIIADNDGRVFLIMRMRFRVNDAFLILVPVLKKGRCGNEMKIMVI